MNQLASEGGVGFASSAAALRGDATLQTPILAIGKRNRMGLASQEEQPAGPDPSARREIQRRRKARRKQEAKQGLQPGALTPALPVPGSGKPKNQRRNRWFKRARWRKQVEQRHTLPSGSLNSIHP